MSPSCRRSNSPEYLLSCNDDDTALACSQRFGTLVDGAESSLAFATRVGVLNPGACTQNHSDHSFIGSRCRQRVKPLGRPWPAASQRGLALGLRFVAAAAEKRGSNPCPPEVRVAALSRQSRDVRVCTSSRTRAVHHPRRDDQALSGENQKTSRSGRAGAPHTIATSQSLPCERVCSERRGSESFKMCQDGKTSFWQKASVGTRNARQALLTDHIPCAKEPNATDQTEPLNTAAQ
jgi:hypothetical protein